MTGLAVSPAEIATYGQAAAIMLALDDSRSGNPWPLIELLWGRVVRTEEVLSDPDLPSRLRRQKVRHIVVDDPQYDIIASALDGRHRKVMVKGNTGCGKSFSAAIVACVYFLTFNDSTVIVTRDSYDTAVKLTFAEIAGWWNRMAFRPPQTEVLTTGIVDLRNRQHAIRVASPKTDEGFSGAHSPHVLIIFDEATAPVLNGRYGLADTQATTFLALGNPRTTSGDYRREFERSDEPDQTQTVLTDTGFTRLITIGGNDCLNVKAKRLSKPVAPPGGITIRGREFRHGETIPADQFEAVRAIIPGQTCYDQFLGHLSKSDKGWVRVMAHGLFPDENLETALIRRAWLRPCREGHNRWQTVLARATRHRNAERWRAKVLGLLPVQSFGLDVGGSTDGDPSILTAGGERGVRAQFEASISDATQIADWVVTTARQSCGVEITHGGYPVCVDCDGIGWGVAGILRKLGVRVVEFRGNAPSDVDARRYANKRAESYGEMARRLDPAGEWAGVPWCLPDDERLAEELTAPERLFGSDGLKFAITPKRRTPGVKDGPPTVYDRIGRSPDRGDSVGYWYRAQQAVGRSLVSWLDAGAF